MNMFKQDFGTCIYSVHPHEQRHKCQVNRFLLMNVTIHVIVHEQVITIHGQLIAVHEQTDHCSQTIDHCS